MNKREIREALAVHADRLIRGGPAPPNGSTRYAQIQELLDLAEELNRVLVPVEMEANFRRRLHGDLILEAQGRQDEPEASLFQQHRKGILIGAAAIGSVASVVGVIIAFVLRYRQGRATHIATG